MTGTQRCWQQLRCARCILTLCSKCSRIDILQRQKGVCVERQAGTAADSWCHKTYVWGPGSGGALGAQQSSRITLRLSKNLLEGGTGCHEWEAGFQLTEFILSYPLLVEGAPSACLDAPIRRGIDHTGGS